MKTVFPTKEQANSLRGWCLVDAKGVPLGRLASKVAALLRGKNKASFSPHVDCGEFVVVINAKEVKLTGKKTSSKVYYDHSGYIGGLRATPYAAMIAKRPNEVIRRAVKGMLPSGPLGNALIKKLKVYPGGEHPHQAQTPQACPLV